MKRQWGQKAVKYIVICTIIRSLIYSYNLEDLLIFKTWVWVKWDMVKTGAGHDGE